MYVFREILHCKPGKVRPMIEKFKIISRASREAANVSSRIFTDVSGEPFWTVIAEIEVEKLEDFFALEEKLRTNPEVGTAMSDYHELVVSGRREILKRES